MTSFILVMNLIIFKIRNTNNMIIESFGDGDQGFGSGYGYGYGYGSGHGTGSGSLKGGIVPCPNREVYSKNF